MSFPQLSLGQLGMNPPAPFSSFTGHSGAAWWGKNLCSPVADLTKPEMETLKLIAQGMSNSDIAREMVISGSRVKGHVSNILSKLHLADRPQAAVYDWQQGVVRRK